MQRSACTLTYSTTGVRFPRHESHGQLPWTARPAGGTRIHATSRRPDGQCGAEGSTALENSQAQRRNGPDTLNTRDNRLLPMASVDRLMLGYDEAFRPMTEGACAFRRSAEGRMRVRLRHPVHRRRPVDPSGCWTPAPEPSVTISAQSGSSRPGSISVCGCRTTARKPNVDLGEQIERRNGPAGGHSAASFSAAFSARIASAFFSTSPTM
jgi:hypothetical protein